MRRICRTSLWASTSSYCVRRRFFQICFRTVMQQALNHLLILLKYVATLVLMS